ncbi:MAG TPA: type IV secretion system DNA-binding domain-containing protein [Rhabdochlamydiaceae bacterium]|nr:type IV secretion system DNA-binding domain-containing protein [Rhabdochlamydiaceae bacterium]
MRILKTITEGGQIWAHRVRMTKQVLKIASLTSLVLIGLFFLGSMLQIPFMLYKASAYYLKAQIFAFDDSITINGQVWGEITHHPTSHSTLSLKPAVVSQTCKRHFSLLLQQLTQNVQHSLSLGTYTFSAAILFFLLRGLYGRRQQHLNGKQLISPSLLALKLKLSRKASPLRLGNLPLVKGTETQHLLISGATGTGKTNALHSFLPQIRNRHQRAIVVDITGEFVEKYYQPSHDIILNPFDSRSAQWHPWAECLHPSDYKTIAQSFIPSSYREDENFWRKGAQEVFSAALKALTYSERTSALSKLLLHDSLSQLSHALQGTTATAYLDMAAEKTAGSIRAVASSFLETLELLPDTDNPFSIRHWIQQEQSDGWLFLTCSPQHRSSSIPLISTWLSIAISNLLQLNPDPKRRLWFILDELPRLNRLKDLENFLTESRKFGGCGVLSIQSPAQLETIYGKEVTSTLLGNCATRVAFAEYDPEIAYRISKTFGNKEVKETQEAISYGAHEMRDGVNLAYHKRLSPTERMK